MRVLVTGGAGFIGSHVVDALIEDGHTVGVLDNLSTGLMANVPATVEFFQVDVTEVHETAQAVAKFAPEAIYHFAAQVSVPRSFESPQEDADINILGLLNVLTESRMLEHRPRIVFASSGGAVYGEAIELPCTESTFPNPATPYGIAKLAAEQYLTLFGRTYGLPFVILRFANVFGPRQGTSKETGVCAIFTRQAVAGEPLTIFGDGSQTRDYIHASDVASASLSALTRGAGEIMNLGQGVETSTINLARVVLEVAGCGGEIEFGPARTGDVCRSCLESSKARSILNWAPAFDLRSGIAETIAWQRNSELSRSVRS